MKLSKGYPLFHLFEHITIGLPFCVFKVATGLTLRGALGQVLVVLGAVDLLINCANIVSMLYRRKGLVDECTFAICLHYMKRPSHASDWARIELGKSIDVLLSFALVALMIGVIGIQNMQAELLHLWNIGVIFNVLGAGLLRFAISYQELIAPQ